VEGFVLTITPFNFTAIGETYQGTQQCLVANTQIYSANDYACLKETGLPDGIYQSYLPLMDRPWTCCMSHPDLQGCISQSSTGVFNQMWGNTIV